MARIGNACVVFDDSVEVGLRKDYSCNIARLQLFCKFLQVGDAILLADNIDDNAVEFGVGLYHPLYLGINGGRKKNFVAFLGSRHAHHHCLGCGCATIVHRGIRNVHSRQLGNHRLILENILQRTLRNFGLVGGVGCQKLAARDYGVDYRGSIVVLDACTRKADEIAVLFAQSLEEAAHLNLGHCLGQCKFAVELQFGRNFGKKVVQ